MTVVTGNASHLPAIPATEEPPAKRRLSWILSMYAFVNWPPILGIDKRIVGSPCIRFQPLNWNVSSK
jgi:hypothetical protein